MCRETGGSRKWHHTSGEQVRILTASSENVHALLLLFSHLVVSDSLPPHGLTHHVSLSFTISWSLLKLVTLESVMSSNHPILCHPLLFLPSIFPSIKIFSNELTLCVRWPKYWSFTISPSSEHSGLISFRIGWFDLLAVQGALKSLLQHHSSNHQFFGAQPSLWSNTHIHT